jgi:hypothetical protein
VIVRLTADTQQRPATPSVCDPKHHKSVHDEALITFVVELVDCVERTAPVYASNMRRDRLTHAIPFFGDVLTAEALTVGVNPSADEFTPGRWPTALTAAALTDRLRGYFGDPGSSPHPWFDKWSEVLGPLGYAYTRNAAHVDVSPRATVSMSAAPDQAGFERMLDNDARWLFKLLPLCPHARVMFLAGAVSKREYLFEFLRRVAPASGFRLEPVEFATDDKRRQAPRFLRLTGPGLTLSVFSVGNSPSSRNSGAMFADLARSRGSLVVNGFRATGSSTPTE